MNKYYTRTGDDGTTGILGGGRLPKNHPRLEAVGVIDEVTAALGVARANSQTERCAEIILSVQGDLYTLMSEVAALPEHAEKFRTIDEAKVTWLEKQIETIQSSVKPPKEFIIPGDTSAGAVLDLARTIVRRAERRAAGLYHNGDLENVQVLRYLNRLSSLCFALELLETQAGGKNKPTLVTD
ncbi:MAG: cob(I)yrinic acid a,c-diamide adenosyltransferase [Anaerolineales bacterium]|nr:cob(I)yrinic acid a,c-diamide adenosyltransferase [Anaerolineales bacterium]